MAVAGRLVEEKTADELHVDFDLALIAGGASVALRFLSGPVDDAVDLGVLSALVEALSHILTA